RDRFDLFKDVRPVAGSFSIHDDDSFFRNEYCGVSTAVGDYVQVVFDFLNFQRRLRGLLVWFCDYQSDRSSEQKHLQRCQSFHIEPPVMIWVRFSELDHIHRSRWTQEQQVVDFGGESVPRATVGARSARSTDQLEAQSCQSLSRRTSRLRPSY